MAQNEGMLRTWAYRTEVGSALAERLYGVWRANAPDSESLLRWEMLEEPVKRRWRCVSMEARRNLRNKLAEVVEKW